MKNPEFRIKRYEERIKATHLGKIYQKLVSSMKEQYAIYISEIYQIEELTKGLLVDEGVSVMYYSYYLSFAREAYRLIRRNYTK